MPLNSLAQSVHFKFINSKHAVRFTCPTENRSREAPREKGGRGGGGGAKLVIIELTLGKWDGGLGKKNYGEGESVLLDQFDIDAGK